MKYPIVWGAGTLTGTTFNPAICGGGAIAQATAAEINSFCASTVYTRNRFSRQASVGPVNNQKKEFELKASPNPFKETIMLSGNSGNETIIKIQVLDALGNELYNFDDNIKGSFSKPYNLGKLSSGLYLVKAITEAGNINTLKIILNR